VISLSINFPLELKTGFFRQEQCMVRIDHHHSQIFFDFQEKSDIYVVEFEHLKRIVYSPGTKHEIEFQTSHNAYVGYVSKDEIQRGIIEILKVEFGDRFKEIHI
jgi:hypothetical protein